MRQRSGLAAAAASVLLVTAMAGCANLPTSGSVRLSTLHGSGDGSAPIGVQFVPVAPSAGWRPSQIVRGFLAASASFAHKHAVAREYLTTGYASRWRPGWAATVLGSPSVGEAKLPRHPTVSGGSVGALVNVQSQYVAKMTAPVKFGAGNVVVTPGPNAYQFVLTDDKGLWRISAITLNDNSVPSSILLLTQPDFQRDYQPRNLYYLSAGSAGQTLIPEPVYIPLQGIRIGDLVSGLVRSLFTQPSGANWLWGAASTAFPPHTKVLSVRVVGGIKAIVNLGGKAGTASQAQRRRMAAQLYETLTSSPYTTPAANQIRSVVLEFNNRTWRQPLPPPYASWVPRTGAASSAATLYLQGPGGHVAPAIEVFDNDKLVPVSLPRGLGDAPFTSIAVTPGPSSRAVLAGCVGKRLYLVPLQPGAQPVTTTLAASCTSLSWDASGNLWLTAGNEAWVLRGAGAAAAPVYVTRVYCTYCTGTIAALRVAPDGARVAMIIRSGKSSQVMVGAISTKSRFTYVAQTTSLVRVGSDIANPGGLTWLDPDHLLVLDQAGSAGSAVYEVPLSGGTSTLIATPRYVQWLTASWPEAEGQLRIFIGIPGPKPQVLTSLGGLLDRGWSQVAKGTLPVFPG